MQGGVLELARQAAAAARAERGARGRGAARVAVRRYRGVVKRDGWYVAETMDDEGLRPLYLGSYATPEEAAYAYDAAARILRGDKAMPNFPEPPAPPAAPPAGARRLPLLGHARMRSAPLYGQPPAPPQAPEVPVVGGEQRQQAFSVSDQQAPAPHFGALPGPYHGGAASAFSEFLYLPDAGPAFGDAGRSDGAGFFDPALAAAGGSDGEGFFGMADMIGPEPKVPWPFYTYAASSALSTSDKETKAVVDASAAAEPKLMLVLIIDSDGEPVVDDNFPGGDVIGASTSSAARPAEPPLRLKDLMESEVLRRSADEGVP